MSGRQKFVVGAALVGSGFLAGGVLFSRRSTDKAASSCTNCYVSGAISGLLLASITAVTSWRFLFPKPEQVLNRVLPMLRANTEVRNLLGSNLQPGQFRAYSHTGGLRWKLLPPSLGWDQRQLEMMFQVQGEHSSAMVSLSCEADPRSAECRSLAVDLPNGERILLKGQHKDVVFRGYTRLR